MKPVLLYTAAVISWMMTIHIYTPHIIFVKAWNVFNNVRRLPNPSFRHQNREAKMKTNSFFEMKKSSSAFDSPDEASVSASSSNMNGSVSEKKRFRRAKNIIKVFYRGPGVSDRRSKKISEKKTFKRAKNIIKIVKTRRPFSGERRNRNKEDRNSTFEQDDEEVANASTKNNGVSISKSSRFLSKAVDLEGSSNSIIPTNSSSVRDLDYNSESNPNSLNERRNDRYAPPIALGQGMKVDLKLKQKKQKEEVPNKSQVITIVKEFNDEVLGRGIQQEKRKKWRKVSSNKPQVITNVEELRDAVLEQGIPLQDLEFDVTCFQSSTKKERVSLNKKFNSMETFKSVQQKLNMEKMLEEMMEAKLESDQMKIKQNSFGRNSTNNNSNSSVEYDQENLPFNHEVIKIIEQRFKTNSIPGSREDGDTAHLALSIEGGGMRGAVSAGMASAIAVLGLSDCFDSIYGSSAGSVIGAYMVSRQMCIDVYTQILTAAKSKFVSKGRLASSLATNLLDQALNYTIFSKNMSPAMNISFVLDSIMDPENGLRPLDMEAFELNDQRQQLRIVTSCVQGGKMVTHCLGSQNRDFFDVIAGHSNGTDTILERATTMKDGKRHGLFACLETSMTVPTATGPPIPLLRNKDAKTNMTSWCFDAFCYEPIPYRSAVEEGATHVLVLKTRPEGNPIGTVPGLFEKYFAPMYFDGNNMSQVSEYFENGGQQYIYVEDYLTLYEGAKASKDGVKVPPRKILYGVDRDEEALSLIQNRDEWKQAHLLPISVPAGTPELATLSVDTMEVLQAVRQGFAIAFDLLAPSTGIELNSHLNGKRVSELIFANKDTTDDEDILLNPILVAGHSISDRQESKTIVSSSSSELLSRFNDTFSEFTTESKIKRNGLKSCHFDRQDSLHLLEKLPGFRKGKMNSLSCDLYRQISRSDETFR